MPSESAPSQSAPSDGVPFDGVPFDAVLFDLDGTISDSAPGILASLRHGFEVAGLPPLDEVTGRSLLGPPFHESLPPLVGAERVDEVIAAYRDAYRAGGMYDTVRYDGIRPVLEAMRAAGVRLAVATSKPEHFAVPIVERLGVAEYFETVGGDTLDGRRGTKALVIETVLKRLGPVDRVVMIGDRSHDVLGAAAHGIGCIGAGWGYGLPGELLETGADPICARPIDLLDVFGLEDPGAAAS